MLTDASLTALEHRLVTLWQGGAFKRACNPKSRVVGHNCFVSGTEIGNKMHGKGVNIVK